ncbi:MAG: ABC transporter permease [Sulfolobales archaeon]
MKFRLLKTVIQVLRFLTHHTTGLIGLTILSIMVSMALLAPYIAPYDPWKIVGTPMSPPSPQHLLGVNDAGQDILSELIYGARVSLLIGFISALLASLIGMILGLFAGYYGGFIDRALIAITDIMLLTPAFPLMIVLAVFIGPGVFTIIIVIVLTSWAPVSRMIRAQVLSLKNLPFIEAVKAIGAGDLRIIFKYITPQILPLVVTISIIGSGEAMIAEASLSFLGLGDPLAKSWGSMLHWAFRSGGFTYGAWWWFVPPGLCIALAVFGFASLGYALEEYLNPRLRERGIKI